MKKQIFTALAALTILGTINACTKNEQVDHPPSVSETKRHQLSVPLEDGRTFIEAASNPAGRLISQQRPVISGFLKIPIPDESYLSSTTLIKIKNAGDFAVIDCIADKSLKVTFTNRVSRMPGYPSGWTAIWNRKPAVENEAPSVLYTRQQNRLTLQLSKYVTTFGFELAPNQYNAFPFTVGFYDSKENPQVAYLQDVAWTPEGAKLFAVSSQKPFNVVEIAFAGEGESVNHPYGFAITNVRYKLAK